MNMPPLIARFSQPPLRVAALLGMLTLALTLFISLVVFRGYPFSVDEYINAYQADIFASGQLAVHTKPYLRPLYDTFMVEYDGGVFSKYPPGISALLAIGSLIGIESCVNPLITTISIVFIYFTLCRLTSTRMAAATTLLLAVNSYLLGYGASYFAQPLTLCLTAAAFYFFVAYVQGGSKRSLVLAGLSVGLMFLVRPLDAFCMALAFSAQLMPWWRYLKFWDWNAPDLAKIKGFFRQYWQDIHALILFSGNAFTGVAALLLYNYIQAGCFCVATYTVWNREFKIIDPHASDIFENIISIVTQYFIALPQYLYLNFIGNFLPVLGAPFLLLSLAGGWFSRNRIRSLCLTLITLNVFLYNFHMVTDGDTNMGFPVYGARYWYPLLVPLAIFAATGMEYMSRRFSPRTCLTIFGLTLVFQLVVLATNLSTYSQRFTYVEKIKNIIYKKCPPKSIVTLYSGVWYNFLDEEVMIQPEMFRRNAFFNGDMLFVDFGQQAKAIGFHYHDYNVCHYILPRNIVDKIRNGQQP